MVKEIGYAKIVYRFLSIQTGSSSLSSILNSPASRLLFMGLSPFSLYDTELNRVFSSISVFSLCMGLRDNKRVPGIQVPVFYLFQMSFFCERVDTVTTNAIVVVFMRSELVEIKVVCRNKRCAKHTAYCFGHDLIDDD